MYVCVYIYIYNHNDTNNTTTTTTTNNNIVIGISTSIIITTTDLRPISVSVNSFHARPCPAVQHRKMLSSPWFGRSESSSSHEPSISYPRFPYQNTYTPAPLFTDSHISDLSSFLSYTIAHISESIHILLLSYSQIPIRQVFIISNRKISNWASQIPKTNTLLICPYCLKVQIARV